MAHLHHVKKTLIVGEGPLVGELTTEISCRTRCEYEVVGIVVNDISSDMMRYGYPLLGSVEKLHEVIRKKKPELIVIGPCKKRAGLFDQHLLEAVLTRGVRVEHAAITYERLTGKVPLDVCAAEHFIYSPTFRANYWTLLSTRLLSLVVGLVGVILFFPLWLLIAALIRLNSRGPVFFIQERTGLDGKRFKLLKFRTMKPSVQAVSEWEGDNVHRITTVGRWLRKFRLDELPQFLNILKGDMNIVGPRPHPLSNFELMVLASRNTSESGIPTPYYALRSSVRPGITGWAQVRYRYANNLQEELEKLQFDLYYVKHYSLWLDIRIMLETVGIVLAGRGASNKIAAQAGAASISQAELTPQVLPRRQNSRSLRS